MNSGCKSCDETVRRLLRRCANRVFQTGTLDHECVLSHQTIGFPATNASLPEYYALERFADRQEYHARARLYAGHGAIALSWDPSAGDAGQLARVELKDPKAAAAILGQALPWEIAQKAIQQVKALQADQLPTTRALMDAWRYGKSAGGIPAEKADQISDAIRVIKETKRLNTEKHDALLRRVSADLFNDTKRIESLARPLALLLEEPDPDEPESVFARLGLVKHPQTMLLHCTSEALLSINGQHIKAVQPYIGFAPTTLTEVRGGPIQCVISIENLSSFNEAAFADNNCGLVAIYTAGHPSPSLLDAYQKILRSLKPASVLHWGDVDLGGFRIASRIAERAAMEGYRLDLWGMCSTDYHGIGVTADPGKLTAIHRICERHGWTSEAQSLNEWGLFHEQEAMKWRSPK